MKLTTIGNKRGSLADVIFGGAYLLKISITILICLFIWMMFQTQMLETIVGSPGESIITQTISTLTAAYFSIDYLFPLIVGGLLLVSSILAYKVGANYLLAFFSLIIWAVAFVLAALFVNVYLSASEQFPTIYAELPIMDFLMSNLHWLTLFWLVIITALMFRKNNLEDENSSNAFQGRFYGP